MLLMVQVKMNESIYAIFRTVRTYLSLALLIILEKKNKALVGGGGKQIQTRDTASESHISGEYNRFYVMY